MKKSMLKAAVLAGSLSVAASVNAQVPGLSALPIGTLTSLDLIGSLTGGLTGLDGLPGLDNLLVLVPLDGIGGLDGLPGLDSLPIGAGEDLLKQLTKTVDTAANDAAGNSGLTDQVTDLVDALPSGDANKIQGEAVAIGDEVVVLVEHLQTNLTKLAGGNGLPIPGLDALPGLDGLPGADALLVLLPTDGLPGLDALLALIPLEGLPGLDLLPI